TSDQNSPWALRHRAYAYAFAGLHRLALVDLQSARKADSGRAEEESAHGPMHWVRVVDALCRFDEKSIAKQVSDDKSQLAVMATFIIVEQSACVPLVMGAAQKAFEIIPECYWIYDALGILSGVSVNHVTTVQSPAVLQRTLADRLREMPHLPDNVTALL